MGLTQSTYAEQPPPALAGRLVCLWTQAIDGAAGQAHLHGVLPDGCADIVWIGDRPPIVAGPATRRVVVSLPAGTRVHGVRFQPGCAGAFLGVPMDELRDREIPLAELWGGAAARLTETLFRRDGQENRQRALADALLTRPDPLIVRDPVIEAATRWLSRHPGGRVADLAALLDLSERQLHRRFAAAVGYPPKTFQRIMRLHRLLMAFSGRPDLAELAVAAGYADQAHMCREVRALSDATPSALRARGGSTLQMSELFNTAPPNDHRFPH